MHAALSRLDAHLFSQIPIPQLVAVAGCGDEVNAAFGVLLAHIIVWHSRKTKLLNLHCLEPKMYMDDGSSNLPVRIVGNLDDAALAQLQTLPPMTRWAAASDDSGSIRQYNSNIRTQCTT